MRATVQLVESQVRHMHAETLCCGKIAGFRTEVRSADPKLHPHRLLALSLDLFFSLEVLFYPSSVNVAERVTGTHAWKRRVQPQRASKD